MGNLRRKNEEAPSFTAIPPNSSLAHEKSFEPFQYQQVVQQVSQFFLDSAGASDMFGSYERLYEQFLHDINATVHSNV